MRRSIETLNFTIVSFQSSLYFCSFNWNFPIRLTNPEWNLTVPSNDLAIKVVLKIPSKFSSFKVPGSANNCAATWSNIFAKYIFGSTTVRSQEQIVMKEKIIAIPSMAKTEMTKNGFSLVYYQAVGSSLKNISATKPLATISVTEFFQTAAVQSREKIYSYEEFW